MGNCLGLLRRFIRQYSQQDDLCLRRKPFLNAKAARKFNFSRKDPPPKYAQIQKSERVFSPEQRKYEGKEWRDVWEAFTTRTSPSAPRKDALHGDRPLLYPAHLPPNSFAEFENDFIAYIDSEHVSLRLFSSKKPKPSLPLRKSLGKMWKTALNNIPPSSQNPSKVLLAPLSQHPPNRDFIRFYQAPLWGKE